MEVLFSFVADVLVELGKCVSRRVNNTISFQSNLESLKTEVENLKNHRDTVKAKVDQAENDGLHERTAEVTNWLDQVDAEVNSIQSKMEEANKKRNQFKLLCCLGTTEMADLLTQVKQLTKDGNFPPDRLVVENNQPTRVDHIPGPSIENQSTAMENLSKVLNLLNNDDVRRIGVWGMGGVGKTTLVKNLNNKLEESSSTTTRHFSIVIWVTVSRDFDPTRVQTQIAERLKLEVSKNESVERMASKLYESLKKRSFVLILDDVWKSIDLTCLGIPLPEQNNSCKIILTSRSLDVCRRMETDKIVKVDILNDEESWKLFASKAGEVATLTHIEPLAKQITRECHGLPLAINVVGASMRGKEKIELWTDALNSLQRSIPHIPGIEAEVYEPLKWSYDSLQGMENINGNLVDIKSCFLYCCLYPEDFSIDVKELVHCWLAEGFIDDEFEENYEASYNRGIALVEYLKDSCLLEVGLVNYDGDTVKMHDVVRDVAIRIACSLEAEVRGFHVQSGIGLAHIRLHKLSKSSLKRVSFIFNRITSLPDCEIPFPHISSLLLQHNLWLENVAEGFLLGFPALKFLNLSHTDIQTLPPTLLLKCSELQALFLENCHSLVEIPSLRGLINLKMIDLSWTAIKELPEGMETLTNLRQLFLMDTNRLNKIRAGIISQLYSLEILDMTASAYKWAARGVREREGEGEGEASFEELGCLTQLSVLNIHLDVSCLPIYPPACWFSELKKFQFFVGNEVQSYSIISKFDERRATLQLNNFSDTWSLGPLKCATSMILLNCEGFEQKPKKICFNNLRSLRIENTHLFEGENKGNHVASSYDLLPNLEELFLYWVEGINSISDLAGHFGLRLQKLRVITMHQCHSLKYVLSVRDSGLVLESLEEVRAYSCSNVVDLFRCESSSQSSALVDTSALNLKIVELKYLRRLETLSQPHVSWQRLERLEVFYCGLLKKLPFTAQIANTIKEIRGESQWWDQLEWDDEHTKSNLQQYFTRVAKEVFVLGDNSLYSFYF